MNLESVRMLCSSAWRNCFILGTTYERFTAYHLVTEWPNKLGPFNILHRTKIQIKAQEFLQYWQWQVRNWGQPHGIGSINMSAIWDWVGSNLPFWRELVLFDFLPFHLHFRWVASSSFTFPLIDSPSTFAASTIAEFRAPAPHHLMLRKHWTLFLSSFHLKRGGSIFLLL